MTPPKRDSATRERHRNQIRKAQPACGICGQPIDYTLPHLHPKSYVLDHVVPLNKGGTDTIANKQAAHRDCNRKKSDRTDGGGIIKRSQTLTGA